MTNVTSTKPCEHIHITLHSYWETKGKSGFVAFCPDCGKHYECREFKVDINR